MKIYEFRIHNEMGLLNKFVTHHFAPIFALLSYSQDLNGTHTAAAAALAMTA